MADQILRVPLHTDDEAPTVLHLGALDDPVRGPRDGREPAAERLQRLVVEAVHVHVQRPEDSGEARALLHLHVVHRLVPPRLLERLLAVVERRREIARDVLEEAPAERDVQHLKAAADREERHAAFERPVGQLDLERVTRRRDLGRRRVARLAEARGVHVTAAREEHAVDPREQRRARRRAELRRQHHRHTARLLDRIEVRRVDVRALRVLVHGDGGRDADEWERCHRIQPSTAIGCIHSEAFRGRPR